MLNKLDSFQTIINQLYLKRKVIRITWKRNNFLKWDKRASQFTFH